MYKFNRNKVVSIQFMRLAVCLYLSLDYTTHNGYEYKSAGELNISYSMTGNLTTYKDGGFVHTFNRDITYEEF